MFLNELLERFKCLFFAMSYAFVKILILTIFLSAFANAQSDSLFQSFHLSRTNINQTGMLVLGGWAIANMLIGTYGNFKSNGETKYFHQFNAMWNTVNLAIATFGYLNATNSNIAQLTNLDILKDYNSLQSFLLLNTGLDLAYIMTGFYLKERAKNSKHFERLKGYGNSLLLQGTFLLVFDLSLFFIHQTNANINLYPHLENLLSNEFKIGIQLKL